MEMRVPVCKYGCLQPSPSPRHTQDNKVKRKKKGVCLNGRQKCKQYTGTVALPWRSPEMRSQNPTGNIWQTTITHWSSECKHHLPEEAAQTSVRPSLPVIYYWGARPDLSTALTPAPQPWHWRIHLCTGTHSTFAVIWSETLFELGKFRLRANSRKNPH